MAHLVHAFKSVIFLLWYLKFKFLMRKKHYNRTKTINLNAKNKQVLSLFINNQLNLYT